MEPRRAGHALSLSAILRASGPWRLKCLKLCDAIVGRLLLRGRGRRIPADRAPVALARVRRVLVIRPGGIGDAVLLVPFLRQVRETFPQATVDLVAERRNAEVFEMLDGTIDHLYCYDRHPWSMWRELAQRSYDIVYDTEQWHHASALLARATGAPIRIGFDTNPARNRCYTTLVPYRQDDFEGESFLRLLSTVIARSVRVDWHQPFLQPRPADRRWADERLAGRAVVAIALRGGVRERCWDLEKFSALVPRLQEIGFDACLLLGSRSDRPWARRLARRCPAGRDRLIDLTGAIPLARSVAIVSRCRLFIGTDSGLMHLAAAVGTPVVALFGAGIAAKWAPRGPRHRVVNHHLACSPCTRFGLTPVCPIRVRCLREISVEEVFRAAREGLGR